MDGDRTLTISTEPTRHVQQAGGLQWHYREAGAGNAGQGVRCKLVLLHPSPRSSAMYEPWMRSLAAHFHVLAIDTPGYGGSAPLAEAPMSIGDYVVPLHALLSAIAGPRFMLYGSATGAQIAIAYALAHPAAVQHLCIDNAAHFDDDERQQMLAQYFPDLTPRADGSHLQTAWLMSAAMLQFFPWFEQNAAHCFRDQAPSADEVQAAFSELLAAGPGWAQAYRAAFEHERAAHVQALRVPTSVLRWQGSILLKHIDRLLAHALPDNVQPVHVPAEMGPRFAAMTAHLLARRDAVTQVTADANDAPSNVVRT
jgi:pimeloyl-ACP methyl ester carboxylesterase